MKHDVKDNISANLIRIRKLKKCSQQEIALVLNIKQPSYNQMEAGKTRISADQLFELASFYHVTANQFFLKEPDFSVDCCDLHEKNRKLESQLARVQLMNNFLLTRNHELEERLLKNGKIQ